MLAELPETPQPLELWDGEIVLSPSRHADHQRLVLRFCERLNRFVIERALGEVFVSPLDVVLSQRRVVQPSSPGRLRFVLWGFGNLTIPRQLR